MIYDIIENHSRYLLPEVFKIAFRHSADLKPDSPEGKSVIIDGKLTCNIESYLTKCVTECKPEAHKKYIDIQMLLSGCESVIVYSHGALEIDQSYDDVKDVMFFKNLFISGSISVNCPAKAATELSPGRFAIFYPWNIHMPQIMRGYSQKVKKVVYKIDISSLEEPYRTMYEQELF